ncbi:uncharacterized protein LOC135406010 [Pseudopipra pipra]|uniref:uncharacterized protein LOC135406010 n=1 Tax=Pseudopipra pipra TaxID=415032 RepID=UPI0031394180
MLQRATADLDEEGGIYIPYRTHGSLFNLRRLKAHTKTLNHLVRELLYADAAALVAHTVAALQRLTSCCAEAAELFGLGVSLKKTQVLYQTEEGAFAHVDDDWKCDTHPDLSQCADVTAWEEDVTPQELYPWEEEVSQQRSQGGARRHRELYEFEGDGRVRELSQWRDGRHPELYQREETVRCQELYEWEEDGVRYQELTRWEEHATVQEVSQREEEETYQELSQWGDVAVPELSQWEGERYHDLPQWEEDVQGHGPSQWKDERDPELSQVGDKADKEQSQEEDYSAQELPQREDRSEKKLSQWGDDVGYSTWDKPWCPLNAGDPQIVPQEGSGSASSVGTEVPAEAARDLPSPAPAPVSATDTEPAAAEEEEPQGPLAPVEEEAEVSPAFGEQVPWAGTQNQVPAPRSPSEGSKALLDTDQSITREILSEPELGIQGSHQEPEDERNLEQTMDTDTVKTVPAERTESPVPAPQSPCSPSSPSPSQVKAQALSEQEEGAGGDSVLAVQDTDEGPFPGEGIGWKYYVDQDISQWEDEGDQELSQETSTYTKKCPRGKTALSRSCPLEKSRATRNCLTGKNTARKRNPKEK